MTPKQILKGYPGLLQKHGSQRRVAKALGVPRATLQLWLGKRDEILFTSQAPQEPLVHAAPKRGVRRWIFTSAQDETAVHLPFLRNLEAYAAHMDAQLVVAGFTYNKKVHEKGSKSQPLYAPEVEPYLCRRQMEIGPNLLFCAEMNTLPTATMPLMGFETYTRGKWGIFPHAKVQLSSVATMKDAPAKQIMTTGAVTLPNYVQKRAGIRAHFHHVLGAVLVEVDSDGDHFCRHLLADDAGSFQDLTRYVDGGVVTDGHRVEAITWGDLHSEQIDPVVRDVNWAPDGMIDILQPRFQFLHDSCDFSSRNHHNVRDPHFMLRTMYRGTESVEGSMAGIARLLASTQRPFCETVVVESNHDIAFMRWLKESDWRTDPVNAEYHLEAQLHLVRQIKAGASHVSMLRWAMIRANPWLDALRFLSEDESFTICGGSIECGIHGHLGANGSKGSPKQFTRMGPKANTGHTHSASIIDGICTAGTSSKLDLGYNKGLSSWSHSHVITYPSGKRTIVTLANGKFAA